MPGFTPNYNIAYPLSGDPINQGAAQMQQLATDVDTALKNAGIPAVAQTNPPRVQAARMVVQSVPRVVDTLISWPTKRYDSEAVRVPASPMFVAGNNFVTIRVPGVYHINSQIYKASSSGNWNHRILYNGTAWSDQLITEAYPGTTTDSNLSGIFQLGVGDVLRVMVWHDAPAAVNFGPGGNTNFYTRFSVTYMGGFTA